MAAAKLIIGIFLLWAFLFLWSFVELATTEVEGSGFVHGVNRLGGFLAWQVGAVVAAALAFTAGRLQPEGLSRGVRRLTTLPLYFSAALWVLIVVAGITLFLIDRTDMPIK